MRPERNLISMLICLILLLGVTPNLVWADGALNAVGDFIYLFIFGFVLFLAGMIFWIASLIRFLMHRTPQRRIYALVGNGFGVILGILLIELADNYLLLCFALILFVLMLNLPTKVPPAIDLPPPSE